MSIPCRPFKKIFDAITVERAGFAVAVVGAFFAYQAWRTAQDQLTASQRAWIAPGAIEIERDFDNNTYHEVVFHYANLGNEPATNVWEKIEAILVPVAEIHDERAIKARIRGALGNVECRNAKPLDTGGVLFPSGASSQGARVGIEPQMVNEVIGKTSYLAIVGCFAYRTAGKVAHSEFCRFFDFGITKPSPTSRDWKSSKCFIAEYAN